MYNEVVVFKPGELPAPKTDVPAFDNAAEDASSSPGPGGTRRAGNLWTAEARDDMYRRRENGESWEDICKDYPRRSRHAMQQQYSMMKKQKAIANGTWTTNRRGRKRRNPEQLTAWPPRPRAKVEGHEGEEDATEDDEMAEMGSEDVEEAEESESYAGYHEESGAEGRFAISRSVTEPVISKPQPRVVSFSQHQPAIPKGPSSNGATPPSISANGSYSQQSVQYNGATAPRKRRRVSQDMGSSASPMMNVAPIPNSSFVPSTVMLDSQDIIALLQRGEERARVMNATLRQEREAERATFEASIARANRRTSEAQDRFSMAAYEHGDNMKLARAEFSDTLKQKAREHSEAMEKLRQQMKSEQEVLSANIESLARQNEYLKSENDKFRAGRPERERELEAENEALTAEVQKMKEDLEKLDSEKRKREENQKDTVAQTLPEARPPSSADLAGRLLPLIHPLASTSSSLESEILHFARKSSELRSQVEDLPHREIIRRMDDLQGPRRDAEASIRSLRSQLEQISVTVTAEARARTDANDGDTVMREAPRTPPADQPLPPIQTVQPKIEERKEPNGVNNYPHLPSARPSLASASIPTAAVSEPAK